jgi:hypothetical protein
MGLFQTKDQTLRTYLLKDDNISAQANGSPYGEVRIQPFSLLNNVLAVTSNYTILDDRIYTRYEVDTTAGDVTMTLPLITNNVYRPIEIAYVKGGTYKVIISPNVSDANKLTNDALNVIWLPKVGNCIKFVHSLASGYWDVAGENIAAELVLSGYAGYGSTDNKIPRFTSSLINIGNMFSENHSSGYSSNAKGLEIVINRSGLYSVTMPMTPANVGGTGSTNGISINSNQLTTALASITASNILLQGVACPYYGSSHYFSITGRFSKGDIIRPHTDGSAPTYLKIIVTYIKS